MDSFLFVGYRVDCYEPKVKNDKIGWGYDQKKHNLQDIPVNKHDTKWSVWGKVPNNTITFLYPFYSYYRCPFGHYTLYEDLDKITLDLPDNHLEILNTIQSDKFYKVLQKDYNKVEIKYGIMKGLG